jgi:uncharacterized damage-inducible protein DinB
MSTTAVTFEELLADNDANATKWRAWFESNDAALAVPCDIYNSGTVRGLLKHIFAVELRHSQRLRSQEVTAYDQISVGSLDDLFAVHVRAIKNLRAFLAQANDASLAEILTTQTLSAGTVQASRRKLFVHILLHSIRHWAQLSTLLRENGFTLGWPQDFFFSSAMD